MQAIKLLRIVVLLLILQGSAVLAFSQDISWMKGLWKEESGTPYRVPPVKCINTLEITTTADSTFNGLQTTFFASDSAIKMAYVCNGLITKEHTQFHRGDIAYQKNSVRKGYEWNDCGICNARTCSLYVEQERIFLQLSTKDADSTCNGTIIYYRELNDFDTTTRTQLTNLYYKQAYTSVLVSYTTAGNTHHGKTNLPDMYNSNNSDSLEKNDTAPSMLRGRINKLGKTLQINSPYIEVVLLDDAEIDGDIVSLYDNNEEVISHKTLGKEVIKYSIRADKQHAHHEMVLVAENLGSIPPNTALMRIRAGEKKYELTTRANMHENAKVIIDYTGE